jgi:hypothetical protein
VSIGLPQPLLSIAERSPSASRLKEIEVMKIIAPGSAATHGLHVDRRAQRVEHQAPFGLGRLHAQAQEDRPEARIIDTAIRLVAYTKIGPSTLPSTCTRTMVNGLAPEARAAST